jgi:hypothetical protein
MKSDATAKPIKIPAFWQHHWPDGKPSGIITDGEKPPPKVADGWIYVFHPAQEVEVTLLPAQIERRFGFAHKIQELDISRFIPVGARLSWRQRLRGIV